LTQFEFNWKRKRDDLWGSINRRRSFVLCCSVHSIKLRAFCQISSMLFIILTSPWVSHGSECRRWQHESH
jgi:hypothetical protein